MKSALTESNAAFTTYTTLPLKDELSPAIVKASQPPADAAATTPLPPDQ